MLEKIEIVHKLGFYDNELHTIVLSEIIPQDNNLIVLFRDETFVNIIGPLTELQQEISAINFIFHA